MIVEVTSYWKNLYISPPLKTFLEEVMLRFANHTDINDEAVQLSFRFNTLEFHHRKGIISNSDYNQQHNQIANAAADILTKITNEFLPILPTKAVAGNGGPQYVVETDKISTWRKVKSINVKNRVGIKVQGDSMNTDYNDGDILICAGVERDEISEKNPMIIVTDDDRFYLKRIKILDNNTIELHSSNKRYKPIKLPINEVREIWKVERKLPR